jgi:ABC-2 type transport system permease protein
MTATTVPTATTTAISGAVPAVRRPSLARLTTVELRKLADTRAGYWLLIIIGLSAVTLVTAQLVLAGPGERWFDQLFGLSLLPPGVLLPVLGILSVTSEWSQRTALTTFALVPIRPRVVAAKLAAVTIAALASVLVNLAVAAAGTVVADVISGDAGWRFDIWALWHAALAMVISVLMGFAFGMLLLNSPLAIVLYFVLPTAWSILGELVTRLRGAAEWLDTGLTMAALRTQELTGGQWARLGVSVLVWVLVPLVAGLVRLLRREVS